MSDQHHHHPPETTADRMPGFLRQQIEIAMSDPAQLKPDDVRALEALGFDQTKLTTLDAAIVKSLHSRGELSNEEWNLIIEAAERTSEAERFLELVMDADQAAVRLWREANPHKTHTLPDRTRLVFYLLERVDALETEKAKNEIV